MNNSSSLLSLIHYQQNDWAQLKKKEKVNPFSKITSISDEDVIIMVYEENSQFPKSVF